MRTHWLIPCILVLALSLIGCAPQSATPATQTLTVMAAASLTESFTELGKQFESQHAGVTVQFNFAGSQQLAQQLSEAAPADVFASANAKQMTAAVDAGRVDAAAPHAFVSNRLVVIMPSANPAGITALPDLAKPGLKLILAAKEVPVGQYSLDFIAKATQDPAFGSGYQDAVLANVVSYEENVKSVLSKVALGEADAGIVYSSDVTLDAAGKVTRIDIPDNLNVIASYPIAVIKDSARAELAQAFVDFVSSAEGQAVLAKYGFLPPSQ